MYDPAALNTLRYFGCENVPLRLFADGAYAGIAEIMKRYNPKRKYCLFPLIFPADSLRRIFSDMKGIAAQKAKLLSAMKSGEKYRIATGEGTDLTFVARKWIPLDFEICTAPVENSINGKIVADGAVFFKKIGEKLSFIIKNGRIDSVSAESPAGEGLLSEYRNMTAAGMKNPANTQLAEIGIGFCPGAEITDCFMEAEAALNTCHFCFGNNICYGGENESDFHGASVLIKNPVFTRMD